MTLMPDFEKCSCGHTMHKGQICFLCRCDGHDLDAGSVGLWISDPISAPSVQNVAAYHDGGSGTLMLMNAGQVEVLRFQADGKVYVRGELVDDNKEVYRAFLEWHRAFLEWLQSVQVSPR